MNMNKLLAWAFAISAITLGKNAMSKTLKIFVGEDTYAPYDFKIETPILGTVNPVLFGYLLKASDTQELSPGLISKWHYDFENHKYSLTLGNHKFHNGREVNATDLEFSIIRGFISSVENYNKIHFSDVLGIETLKPGMKFKSGMVPGLKVVDQKTIEITLKSLNPIFLINFTMPFAPLVPKEELKEDYFTWKSHPIGAGPYQIEKDYQNHVLVLKSVEKADGQTPEFIEYHTSRKTDEYDIIFDPITASEKEKSFVKVFSKYPALINSLFFYRENEFNENINFRKAIYHGIDRDALASGQEQFKPAYEMLVRPYGGRIEPKNPFNLALAKEYIKKLPKSFLEKSFVIGVYASEDTATVRKKERIKLLAKQIADLGLKVTFEANPEKFPTPEVMKKFSMKMWSKVVDLDDPSISYGALSKQSPYKNEMPDSHGKFDELYTKAVQAKTLEDRLKATQDISHLIEEEALIVPILQKYVMYRFNPKTVETLGDQSKPLFMNLSLVKMK